MVTQEKYLKIQHIGSRGVIFSFYEPKMEDTTICYLIKGQDYLFLIDTFLGPEAMGYIKNYLENQGLTTKKIIIFLTHSHWDHHWGTCAFPEALVIGHHLTFAAITSGGKKKLEELGSFAAGEVEIVPPCVTFETELIFPGEGVKFYYSPGHTEDSASCVDLVDNVLIAGDNIEFPLPYVENDHFEQYISTLEGYLGLAPQFIVPGHGQLHTHLDLVEENLEYLRSFMEDHLKPSEMGEQAALIHAVNMRHLAQNCPENSPEAPIRHYIESGIQALKGHSSKIHQDLRLELEKLLTHIG